MYQKPFFDIWQVMSINCNIYEYLHLLVTPNKHFLSEQNSYSNKNIFKKISKK